MPEIRATLHRKCLQLPKPSSLQGLARKAGNWKCRQKLCAPCQLFSYQAKIKRVRLVTMCLAKIGPNAGPGFGRSALCATLDGELAWLRCTLRRIAGGSSYCWQRIRRRRRRRWGRRRRRRRSKVELFDAVTFYLQLGDCTQQIALQCFFLALFCQQELTRATSFEIWTNDFDKIRLENCLLAIIWWIHICTNSSLISIQWKTRLSRSLSRTYSMLDPMRGDLCQVKY